MATDTSFGKVRKFEDFLVTAIADLAEIDVQSVTGDTAAVVAGGADGRLRHTIGNSDDDDVGAVTFGALNWTAGDGDLFMEARIIISDITDNKFFVGFGDTIATSDESSFSATADTVTIDTMSNGIGILFDGDATTKNLWCVAGNTDAVTVGKVLPAKYNPVAAIPITLGVHLSQDRKSARWYVNGEEVYQVGAAAPSGNTELVAAADLVPGVWNYEQGTAFNCDIDYLYASKDRSAT